MALDKNMSVAKIKSFLSEEVKEQIFLEVAPILYIGQEAGGYFGVTRQVLCYVDFLGATYCGFNRRKDRDISMSWKAEKFIHDILGLIDRRYKKNGNKLYEMYRHGLVHLYQPKSLIQVRRQKRKLSWLVYKGGRDWHDEEINDSRRKFKVKVRHMEIIIDPRNTKKDLLAISITCLYKDLLTAIDLYSKRIEQDKTKKLLNNWWNTTKGVLKPDSYP